MLAKRIIPCLDIKDGKTVKGVNFNALRYAGDPVELALKYTQQGADELVFLDISATEEKRETLYALVKDIANVINIPFTVGGGIASVKQVETLLKNGADKISVNSSAVKNPELIEDIARNFGSQCVVVAIDSKKIAHKWLVHLVGGKIATNIDLFQWVKEAEKRGAGEILFTSMDHDGVKKGFANDTLEQLSKQINIPIIASGGAGDTSHFIDVFNKGKADAALAASVFHYGDINIAELKQSLYSQNIDIRL